MAGRRPSLLVHVVLAVIVALWTLPVVGLFVTSLRDGDAVAASGWWTALAPNETRGMTRVMGRGLPQDASQVLEGSLFPRGRAGRIIAVGVRSTAPDAFRPGQPIEIAGGRLVVEEDGRYRLTLTVPPGGGPTDGWTGNFVPGGGTRIFYTARMPAALGFDNYARVFKAEGLLRALLNSILVAVPSTLIPTLVAAFAAYALIWMRFPGRWIMGAGIAALMAVPLQMALIPLLVLYNKAGQAIGVDPRSFIAVWLAHTGFGLPLAVHILRGAMVAVPPDIIASARLDGLREDAILFRIVLPLALPTIAAFATFQFLWTWNDLLVALVFLGPQDDRLVLTGRLLNLLGSRGGEWEILAAAGFVSMAVPLAVYLGLRKFLMRSFVLGDIAE